MKTAEFTNSVDLDEVAHDEPPHRDLHCLLAMLSNLGMIPAWIMFQLYFCLILLM